MQAECLLFLKKKSGELESEQGTSQRLKTAAVFLCIYMEQRLDYIPDSEYQEDVSLQSL